MPCIIIGDYRRLTCPNCFSVLSNEQFICYLYIVVFLNDVLNGNNKSLHSAIRLLCSRFPRCSSYKRHVDSMTMCSVGFK